MFLYMGFNGISFSDTMYVSFEEKEKLNCVKELKKKKSIRTKQTEHTLVKGCSVMCEEHYN